MAFTILPPNTPIVDGRGNFAPEWYRFFAAVQRVVGSNLVEQLQQARYVTWQAESILPNDRLLTPGVGLDLDLDASEVVFSLEDTAVAPGPYGSPAKTVSFTVDQQGRLTEASEDDLNTDNVAEGAANLFFTDARARGALSGGMGIDYDDTTGVIDLADTAVTPDTYGSATGVPVLDIDQQGRITGASEAALPVIASGVWTPTLFNTTNVTATTAYAGQYIRIGNVVHCSLVLDVQAATAAVTVVGISLPVASNLGAAEDLCGCASTTGVQQAGGILADITNDRAQLSFLAFNTTNRSMAGTFSYEII